MTPALRQILLGGRFSPDKLPGLAAWYSADFGVLTSVGPDVPATDGQTVRRWLDRSGNGRHLDQETLLNQPTFSGGRVLGDGATSTMRNSSMPSGNLRTYYIVLDQVAWANLSYILDEGTAGARFLIYQRFSTPTIAASGDVAANNQLAIGAVGVFSYVANAAGATTRVNLNSPIFEAASRGGGGLLAVFSQGAGASGYSNVGVRELVRYDAVHDSAEQQKVIRYLARKWGISL